MAKDAFKERDQLELAGEVAREFGNAVEFRERRVTLIVLDVVRCGKLRHVRHCLLQPGAALRTGIQDSGLLRATIGRIDQTAFPRLHTAPSPVP